MRKRVLFAAAVIAALLCACAQTPESAPTIHATAPAKAQTNTSESAQLFTCNGEPCDAGTLRITQSGSYRLRGTLTDGMVVVDAGKEDAVELILDGVQIASSTSAAIYVRQAQNVTITLAENSENILENGGTFQPIDEANVDAVIFAKDDLTFSGTGALRIFSPAGHGIVSKGDLTVKSGCMDIASASHGMSAKETLTVLGGSMTIDAGKDGLHAENADDASKGSLSISGGELCVTAGGDGASASGDLTMQSGTLRIVSGGGSQVTPAAEDVSAKGVKSDGTLTVLGGIVTVDACDDALHANGDVTITGGSLSLSSGDDGIHAGETLTVTDGSITVARSYEGLEGKVVAISGGDIAVTSSDDGINAAGGADQSGFSGFFGGGRGGDRFGESSSACALSISGGNVQINADGDGIDSNGALEISGGTIWIDGPQKSGNGAIDYGTTGVITGGTLIAVSNGGMEQNFGAESTQGAILLSVGNQSANAPILLTDEAGNELARFTSAKAFSSVIVSAPQLKAGGSYTLSAGEWMQTVTLNGLVYGAGSEQGGMKPGRPSGMPPEGFGGSAPDVPPEQNRGKIGET